tara:strand:- start:843 stop:2654 length:1812 start_codon:yes stop_codon:yes gene_type:complete
MAFTTRDTAAPGFTNKGSALTYAEGDNNFIGLYDRDDLRLALTGGTLTGDFDVASGLILSGGTELSTLWGGGGGGATDLNGLTDAYVSGTNLFLGNDPSATISGTLNHAVGVTALDAITSGDRNTAFGNAALSANQTGSNNTAVGGDTLELCTGTENTAVGSRAGRSIVGGSGNTFLGRGAGELATSSNSVCVGNHAGSKAMTNGYNTYVGQAAGNGTTSGQQNICMGNSAGLAIVTGNFNTMLGYATNGIDGANQIAIGRGMVTTASNTFVLGSDQSGGKTLLHGEFGAVGDTKLGVNLGTTYVAPTATLHVKGGGTTFDKVALLVTDSNDIQLMKLTSAGDNICIGRTAGDALIGGGGTYNVLLGENAGAAITSGDANIVIGKNAVCSPGGQNNIVMGEAAGKTTMGLNNTLIGAYTGFNLNAGNHNVFLGYFAGLACTTGSQNVSIGRESNILNVGSNQIAIGYQVVTTATDQINIGNNIVGSMASADRHTRFSGQTYTETVVLAAAATVTPNFTNGNVFSLTIDQATLLENPTNPKDGGTYMVVITQDGTGGRTMTYGTNYKWEGGTAPTLSIAAGAVDILTFVSDGTNMYGLKALNFS